MSSLNFSNQLYFMIIEDINNFFENFIKKCQFCMTTPYILLYRVFFLFKIIDKEA